MIGDSLVPGSGSGFSGGKSWVETLDILADRRAMEGIRKGERDLRAGRTRSWTDLRRKIERLSRSSW